jgi:hypothetical protein
LVNGTDVLQKLNRRITWDVVLASAKFAQGSTTMPLPMSEGCLGTRRACENKVAPQFGTWIFKKVVKAEEDPCRGSPYHVTDGDMGVTVHPNPRALGDAANNTLANRCVAHFGSLYNEEDLPDAVRSIYPFRPFKAVCEEVMGNNGREKPRVIAVDKIHPKKAAWNVKELVALKSGTGKFTNTKNKPDEFNKVVDNTIIYCTDRKRITDKTNLLDIITNQKGWSVDMNQLCQLVPTVLGVITFADDAPNSNASKENTLKSLKWKTVKVNVAQKEKGWDDFLFNVLAHVLNQRKKQQMEEDDDEEEEVDETSEEVENTVQDHVVLVEDSEDSDDTEASDED